VLTVAIYVISWVARAHLDSLKSIEIASYSFGIIPITLLISIILVFVADYGITRGHPVNGTSFIEMFLLRVFVIIPMAVALIYRTVLLPIHLVTPASSWPRLWLGWICGWFAAMCLMLLTVGILSSLFPADSFHVGFG
jgi:hypothetical protein